MTSTQAQPSQFGWLVNDFAERVPGVAHAVVVSADGLLLTASNRLPLDRADQLAAVASGLVSLTQGAARCFEAGAGNQTAVGMGLRLMVLVSLRDGPRPSAAAAPRCAICH